MEFEENIEIRDIKTKKVKKRFRSITASKIYLKSFPFGLKNYYEIFNNKEQEVIFKYGNYGDEPTR